MLGILDKIQGLWPKANEDEIQLLNRILDGIPEDQAVKLLEDARAESAYSTIPFKGIKAKSVKIDTHIRLSGTYIECWAVHKDTKKYKNCCVLANDNYGANVMMAKYLKNRCNVEPTDYVIFVGKDNFRAFFNYRMGIEETFDSEEF